MLFPGGLNVTITQAGTANLPQFLQTKCSDLTPYLSGDAIKDYPFLAAIPTFAWQNSGSAFGGHLYMLPLQRYVAGQALFKNVSVYDAEIGKDYVPKNADDLKRVYLQLNRPQENRYATASYQNQAFAVNFYAALFGAPNNWRLESERQADQELRGGRIQRGRRLPARPVRRGCLPPQHAQLRRHQRGATRLRRPAGLRCIPRASVSRGRTSGGADCATLRRTTSCRCRPSRRTTAASRRTSWAPASLPPTPSKKPAPTASRSCCGSWTSWPRRLAPRRTCYSSTACTDVDYTLDASGKLTLTDKSNVDANYVNWKYLMQHPQVMYVPDIPGYAKAEYDAEHALIPAGVTDPTLGLFSPTLGTKGSTINRTMTDGITDIVAGRRPLADYDQLVKDWQTAGGDQIRKELMDAMAAASK